MRRISKPRAGASYKRKRITSGRRFPKIIPRIILAPPRSGRRHPKEPTIWEIVAVFEEKCVPGLAKVSQTFSPVLPDKMSSGHFVDITIDKIQR